MAGKAKKAGRIAKRIGKGLLSRGKPRAMSAGTGAAIRLIEGAIGDKTDFTKDNWYGSPLAMFLGSMIISNEKLATPLAVVAGYKAAFNYELNQFQLGKRDTSPVPQFKAPEAKNTGLLNSPGPRNAAGIEETDDAGLMFN